MAPANQTFSFKKATKSQQKLRFGLQAPPGAGKTYTALSIASGLGGRIALIDTEHGSAALYADRFDFDTIELHDFSIPTYVGAMRAAAAAGYEVLIVDSMSHAWEWLNDHVEFLAKAHTRGNTFQAWNLAAPIQRELVEAILTYPGHVIGCMRVKTDYIIEDVGGKKVPRKVGLKAEQGKGIEYEFTLLAEMDQNHFCTFVKDRSGRFQDRIIQKPGPEIGRELLAWLNSGEAAEAKPMAQAPTEKSLLSDVDRQLAFVRLIDRYVERLATRFKVKQAETGWPDPPTVAPADVIRRLLERAYFLELCDNDPTVTSDIKAIDILSSINLTHEQAIKVEREQYGLELFKAWKLANWRKLGEPAKTVEVQATVTAEPDVQPETKEALETVAEVANAIAEATAALQAGATVQGGQPEGDSEDEEWEIGGGEVAEPEHPAIDTAAFEKWVASKITSANKKFNQVGRENEWPDPPLVEPSTLYAMFMERAYANLMHKLKPHETTDRLAIETLARLYPENKKFFDNEGKEFLSKRYEAWASKYETPVHMKKV